MKARVLVIDDLENTLSLYRRFLEPAGYEVIAEKAVRPALEVVRRGDADVVLTDLRMPEIDGLRGLEEIRKIDPDLPVILVTAYASVDTAVEAMRLGAVDYIKKPFDPQEVILLIERSLERTALKSENARLRSRLEHETRAGVVATSQKMREVVALVEKVAGADVPVLIRGETGTGKERVARMLHTLSGRASRPCVTLNCSAIPETLLESELFGHEKGSFSGATEARTGFLRDAADGTLVLDEIGDLSLALQPKLLRVLQSGEYYPVGSHRLEQCRARLIFSTNQDLEALVREGRYREDLYYRINVVTVTVPPLRERPEDVAPLALEFLEHFTRKFGTASRRFAPGVLEILSAHPWPGNVRELRNVVERAALIASGSTVEAADLPLELRQPGAPAPGGYEAALETFEKTYLSRLLQTSGGCVTTAARQAGVHRATLYKWLSRHGLERSVAG